MFYTTRSLEYQKYCVTRAIQPCLVFGGVFTAFDVLGRGASLNPNVLMRLFALNAGGLYVYNILQCPLEAVHGRQSAWHNVLSGGTLGYVGVHAGRLGIPFVDPYFFVRNPQVSPPMAGAVVYGGIAGLLGMLSGKPF